MFRSFHWVFFLSFATLLSACDGPSPLLHGSADIGPVRVTQVADDDDGDSPIKLVGERLFRESRFSEYFYAHGKGRWNQLPSQGDAVVENLDTLTRRYSNPYRGQAISCAACHFVDQSKETPGLGVRAYTDFTRRSPIPDRGDGQSQTVRNSPNMVATSLQAGRFLHGDGEFVSPEDLVRSTFLGRNMGWEVGEEAKAIHQIAEVIRQDNGAFPTETDLGGLSYKDLLSGAARVPTRFLIPPADRMDIAGKSDQEIFDEVIHLVSSYLRSLDYARDEQGHYKGSPYDLFLRKNSLPLAPAVGESDLAYSERLGKLIQQIRAVFVSPSEGRFQLHDQPFVFSEKELAGMKVFFGKGRCIECHAAPDFTDHLFHNTGVSQDEYDRVHGAGAFMKLSIPGLAERNAHADLYLPPSAANPQALSLFRSVPEAADPRRADLGAWVVFGNPALPKPQALLRQSLCQSLELNCSLLSDAQILDHAIGMIKTPSIRDLGQSNPYLHTGAADSIEDVLHFYEKYSAQARAGQVRNADPRLGHIQLSSEDEAALTLFLQSLNEDYD